MDGTKNSLSPCSSARSGQKHYSPDIVLLKDDSHQENHWPIAYIVEIFAGKHGDVWNVKLKFGSQLNCGSALLEQPILKTEVKWDQIKYWFPNKETLHVKMIKSLEGSQILMLTKKGLIKLILPPSCHEGSHFRFMKLFFVFWIF